MSSQDRMTKCQMWMLESAMNANKYLHLNDSEIADGFACTECILVTGIKIKDLQFENPNIKDLIQWLLDVCESAGIKLNCTKNERLYALSSIAKIHRTCALVEESEIPEICICLTENKQKDAVALAS